MPRIPARALAQGKDRVVQHGNLEILEDGFLGFDLPDGTTYERAREIARFMNDNLTAMTFTHIAEKLDDRDPGHE
jgi:hypothetical protein